MSAWSQATAVFKDISGKVEVNNGQKAWIPAKVGMAITKGTVISTGFKSKATVSLGDSVVLVKQLTRMRLDELIEKEGTISTELYLEVGGVTADIKTAEGKKNDFRLKSPVATAAVRGTVIEFSPDTVTLVQGNAVSFNAIQQKTSVLTGDSVTYRTSLTRPNVEDSKIKSSIANPNTRISGILSTGTIFRGKTTVLISLEW
jgi:hypothetical protein